MPHDEFGSHYVSPRLRGLSNEEIMQMILTGDINANDTDVFETLVSNLQWTSVGTPSGMDAASAETAVERALAGLLQSPAESGDIAPSGTQLSQEQYRRMLEAEARETNPFATFTTPSRATNITAVGEEALAGKETSPFGRTAGVVRRFNPADHPDYKKDMERRLPGSEKYTGVDDAFNRRSEIIKGIASGQVAWGLNWEDEPSQVVEYAWLLGNTFDASWDTVREEAERAIADARELLDVSVWNDVAGSLENLDRNVTLKDVPKDRRVADPERAKNLVKATNNKRLAAVHMDNIRLIEDALADPASSFMADRSDDFKQEEIRRLNLEVESLLGGLGLGMAGDPAMREPGAIDKRIEEILAKHDSELEPWSRTITDPDTGDEERITGLYEQPLSEEEQAKQTFIKRDPSTDTWVEGTVDPEGKFKSFATGKDVTGKDVAGKTDAELRDDAKKKALAEGELPLGVTVPQIREKDVSPYTQYSAFLSDELAGVPLGSGLRSYYEDQYDPLFKQFELERALGKYPAVGADPEGLTSFQRFITDPETSMMSGDDRRTLLESALGVTEPVEAPYGVEGWLPFAQSLGGGGVYRSPEQGAERALEFAQWAVEPDIPYALRSPFRRFGKRKFEEYRTESPEKSFLDEYIARGYQF